MQYPVIDKLIYAYLRNGWTGLELSYTNLINFPVTAVTVNGVIFSPIFNGFIKLTGSTTVAQWTFIDRYYYNGIDFNTGDNIYIKSNVRMTLLIYDSNNTLINNITSSDNIEQTFTITNNVFKIRCILYAFDYIPSVGETVEKDGYYSFSLTPINEYIPNTDIAQRLKLPLPHYFPHPVIGALQRAAGGTQTADDTEILQHYLTPLGIGGI